MCVSWWDTSISFAVGLIAGVLANSFLEIRNRMNLYKEAGKIEGAWTAHNMRNDSPRFVDRDHQMDNSQDTKIERRKNRLWPSIRSDSHVLDVSGYEVRDKVLTPHVGCLVLDRVDPKVATRTILYVGSDEVSYQRIILGLPSEDGTIDTLHVFSMAPHDKDYSRHALCRKRELPKAT